MQSGGKGCHIHYAISINIEQKNIPWGYDYLRLQISEIEHLASTHFSEY